MPRRCKKSVVKTGFFGGDSTNTFEPSELISNKRYIKQVAIYNNILKTFDESGRAFKTTSLVYYRKLIVEVTSYAPQLLDRLLRWRSKS